jgi:hypothetical protein
MEKQSRLIPVESDRVCKLKKIEKIDGKRICQQPAVFRSYANQQVMQNRKI